MKRILALTTLIMFPATMILLMVLYASVVEQTAVAASITYPQIPRNLALNHETKNLTRIHTIETSPRPIDKRVVALTKFFEKYNSPLVDHVDTFINTADKHGVDYKILPSISCAESTCGKFLPEGSNNPFGWGVRDADNYIGFESYDQAIEKVGEGMNEIYFSNGRTEIATIAPVYNPVTPQHWTGNVTWFSNQIKELEEQALTETEFSKIIEAEAKTQEQTL